jgi:hypothetical protein
MNSSLICLPDEILLQIFARLVRPFRTVRPTELLEEGPTDYYHDLFNAALVCRRLCTTAREVLLSSPVVPFTKLDRLVRAYLDYPDLASCQKGECFLSRKYQIRMGCIL